MEKRRGKAQRIPRGGADIATCRKAMKSIHFTLRARKNALARPMLYNGAAVLGACLKRTIPTNIGNSFKEKLYRRKLIVASKFQKEPEKTSSIGI